MKHRRAQRQLGRDYNQRKALFRSLVTSVIEHEKIETTLCKAKEVQPLVEKMITLGISGDLHSRRRALSFINNRSIVAKLFDDIAKRYEKPSGGYTKIIKTRIRKGDCATMAIIELTEIIAKTDSKETDADSKKVA